MTTSGVTELQLTTSQVITRAFNRLGVAQEGEALTPRMYNDGLDELNLLIMQMNADPHLWIKVEGSLTLVADQAAYVVSPRALRVWNCRYRLNGIETPMTQFSRQEYLDQPNKLVSTSIPVNFYFDPQVDVGTLYLWPAPSTSTVTQGYDVVYDYYRLMSIQVATNDTLDMPQQWQQALIWNLANNLETQYPVNDPRLAAKIEMQAATSYAMIKGWDNEDASVFFQPEARWTSYA